MSGLVGRLIVPYMVDATRKPIDFKELDADHVDQCAMRTRCGVCGRRIRSAPIAFIGPDDGRTCFADPWMHPACAELAMVQCPFLAGRRDWRDPAARTSRLTQPYSRGMRMVLADNWRSHRDRLGGWHFEALGSVSMRSNAEARCQHCGERWPCAGWIHGGVDAWQHAGTGPR